MGNLYNIWQGYYLGAFSDSSRLALTIIDAVIALAFVLVIVRYLNNRRGLQSLGMAIGGFILLLGSSYFNLPVSHYIGQGLAILAFVGLGLYLYRVRTEDEKKLLDPVAMTLITLGILAVAFVVNVTVGTKAGVLPFEIKLTAANLPEGTAASFGGTTSVKVYVSTARKNWSTINANTLTAIVDVGNQSQGVVDLPVRITSHSDVVRVVSASPARVSVNIEPIIKKTVPITVKYTGKAGNDLVPDDPKLSPDKTEIAGPKSAVSAITNATATVNLADATAGFDSKVILQAFDIEGKVIDSVTFSPAETTVTTSLVKAGKLKTVGVMPVFSGQAASGYWVKNATVSPSAVTITGGVDVLQQTNIISTKSIDITGLAANKSYTVDFDLPSGITLSSSTAKATVNVEITESSTTKQISPTITYEGVNSSLKVKSIDPTSISAWVSGQSGAIGALTDGQVSVTIDLSSYASAGTYKVNIDKARISTPAGITLVTYLPSAMTVILEAK